METTLGQLLINESLPEDMRDYTRVLDKKGTHALLKAVAEQHPDRYKDIVYNLMKLGAETDYQLGSSVSLDDLRSSRTKQTVAQKIKQEISKVQSNLRLNDSQKNDEIVKILVSHLDEIREGTHKEGLEEGNNFSRMAAAGVRGSPANVSTLRGADLIVVDHKDRPIPVPILSNYSEGLSPAEYFAASYGTRKGIVTTKMATAQAGYLGKRLAQAMLDLVVSDDEPIPGTGLPVPTDDPDTEGSVLARDYGAYKAGSVVTPSVLKALRSKYDEILVHSPISAGGGGVPRLAAGYRERGGFSPVGDNIGVAAAQAVSEPISQGMLSSKHSAGIVGGARVARVSGFDAIDQLVQIPGSFRDAAAVSDVDGRVDSIDKAPQGGYYITVNGTKHYVGNHLNPTVKVGDTVEAGDVMSEGIPNPYDIVRHKGVGEGRRYFMNQFRKTLQDQGIKVHRRNLELVARGIVNHVKVTEPDAIDDALPDDVLPYDYVASNWKPRSGYRSVTPQQGYGKYLEKPVLHYSIGTRVTKNMADTLKKHNVSAIDIHDEPPPFEPYMVRSLESTVGHPDFFRRLQGFYVGKGFLDAARRGGSSEIHGRNFGHALAEGVDFGKQLGSKGIY